VPLTTASGLLDHPVNVAWPHDVALNLTTCTSTCQLRRASGGPRAAEDQAMALR